MKILAFAASNSRESINAKVVAYAKTILEAHGGVEVEVLDLNDYELPLYSVDREADEGVPALAKEFYAKIGQADGLVISFAEHNGHYVAAYKNLFDWASRIDQEVYQGKPSVLLSTSPGGGGASSVLGAAVASAQYFGTEVKGSLSIPSFYENFDPAAGVVANSELDAKFNAALDALVS